MKRHIKELAQKDHQEILDQNKDFYQRLVAENYQKENCECAKPKLVFWKKWSVAVATLVMFIATMALISIFNMPNKDLVTYRFEDMLTVGATWEQIEADLDSVKFEPNEGELYYTSMTYDSKSGDHLFYKVTGISENKLQDWEVRIVINKNFALPFLPIEGTNTIKINGYDVQYYETYEVEEKLYAVHTTARIKFADEVVYIQYNSYNFGEAHNEFFNWVENCITKA